MVNQVTLIGHLGNDPELRVVSAGVSVVTLSVATNERYKDKDGELKEQTEWHDVVAWRGLADYMSTKMKKGMLVYIEGKLTHRSYVDKEGNNRRRTSVEATVAKILVDKQQIIDRHNNPESRFENRFEPPPPATPASGEDALPF